MNPGTGRDRREDHEVEAPRKCPACGSRSLVTASKVVTCDSYWRCGDCGEIWNVERQRKANPYLAQPRFRR